MSCDELVKNIPCIKMVVIVWMIGCLVFEHLKVSVKELVYQF